MVLMDNGADFILRAAFNNVWPATSKNLKLKLFVNNISVDTTTDNLTTSDFTEAAGGGYSAKTLTNGSWTVTTSNDPSDVVYAEQTFTFTGLLTNGATIYGYYIVTDDPSPVVVFAENKTSFRPENNGDQYKITPKFVLSKGTAT